MQEFFGKLIPRTACLVENAKFIADVRQTANSRRFTWEKAIRRARKESGSKVHTEIRGPISPKLHLLRENQLRKKSKAPLQPQTSR